MCVAKVSILTGFHAVAGFFLFPIERWGVVAAILVVDKWLGREYVLDSNGCVCVIMGSLLMHELRDAGVPERVYPQLTSSLVILLLLASNLIITAFGENWCIPTPEGNLKRFRGQGHILSHGTIGPLICLVNTCGLLVLLGTCAATGSSQDRFLTNLRVWCFTVISLAWFYTVNYRELLYGSVAPFTPCLVRFSCLLYLPSPLISMVGVCIVTGCVTVTYMRSLKGPVLPLIVPASTASHAPLPPKTPTTVVREACASSAVSYRIPGTLKQSSLPKNPSLPKQPTDFTEPAGVAVMSSQPEGGDTLAVGEASGIDYNYLFQQASLEHMA